MIARAFGRWAAMGAILLLALARPAAAGGGKEIVVDFGAGRVYALQDGKLVRGPIITNNGRDFRERYLGIFPVSEKLADKRSNMYNAHGKPIQPGEPGARMPYWMRLGSSAQGFHYSTLFDADGPRHVSNGCYRLSKRNASWLFNWTPLGTPVHVVYSLAESSHARLMAGANRPRIASRGAAKRTSAAGGAKASPRRAATAGKSRHR